ncbi:MAG: DUF6152 family protein [Bryobacteraceae bacterium]
MDYWHRENRFPVAFGIKVYSLDMTYGSCVVSSIALALLLSASAVAHHGSNVSYQLDKTITVTGTVTEWEFVNPHPQLYFDVKNEAGVVAHWAAELLPTPSMMKNMQVGWSRTSIKPGDQIQLVCNPSRVAGAKACLAKELQVNGKTVPVAPGGGGAPKGKQ